MSDWGVFLDDVEHQLDVLEAAIAAGAAIDAAGAPFSPPALEGPVPPELAARARAAHERMVSAQGLVASELGRTRKAMAMTARAPEAPRFLDTTF